MRRRTQIILTTFFLLALGRAASAQLALLSEAQIPCDKVFAVDGEVAVGADHLVHYRNLQSFDLKTGTVLSTIEKVVYRSIEVNGVLYFLLLEEQLTQGGEIYLFEGGKMQLVDLLQPVFNLLTLPDLNLFLAVTENGFVIVEKGEVMVEVELNSQLLNMVPHGSGFLGVTENSYYFFDANFSISESFAILPGLTSFEGAILNEVLLLRGEPDEENHRPLSLLNTANGELIDVVDSSGFQAMPFSFAIPKSISGDHFFLAGCGQVSFSQFNYSHPTEAGFIHAETGLYTPSNFRPGLWQDVVQPFTVQTDGGDLVFGRMGMEGVEPYSIADAQIEPLADLYPGWGGSVELLVPNSANLGGARFRPEAFEVVEKAGVVYFAARTPLSGLQVWRSNGTAEGTYAITEENLYNKGYDRCSISLYHGEVLLTTFDRDEKRRLYRIYEGAEAVSSDIDASRNWEVVYARNPTFYGGTIYFEFNHPKTHMAIDGSSLIVLEKSDMWRGLVSYNHKWVKPANRIQGFYARTFIQTVNADGSLRSSVAIRAREDQTRTVGRSSVNGRTYALISHRPADTWVNERRLPEPREGHYLIELDDRGAEIKSTFLPTGGKDRFETAHVEVSDDGIYVLGMADRNFTLSGAYSNNIGSGLLRAVLMKFDLDHNLLWIADSGVDQDIFGSGLQNLVLGEEFVYMASGGTSYSVFSSCAFSEWPYQISVFSTDSGERQWIRRIQANDVTRITNMELVGGEWLWVGGYTRGDLSSGDQQLGIQANYLECSYNDFLICINVGENKVSYFNHSDPSRAKFIQDLAFHEDHLYALSLVYEEDPFPIPIFGNDGRWKVQLDKFTNGGVKVDSLAWPTAISNFDFSDNLREHKFGFDFHPDGGIVLAVNRLLNGRIDGFYSPPSSPGYTSFNSWVLQRRDIDELVTATMPPPSGGANDFAVYPNPVYTDAFVLELPSQDVGKYNQLIVMDLHGRVVSFQNLSGPFGSRFISVDPSLSNGTYLIQLLGKSESVVKKLMLQR